MYYIRSFNLDPEIHGTNHDKGNGNNHIQENDKDWLVWLAWVDIVGSNGMFYFVGVREMVMFVWAVHGIVFLTGVDLDFQHSVDDLFGMFFSRPNRAIIQNNLRHKCWHNDHKHLNNCVIIGFVIQEGWEENEYGIVKAPVEIHFSWVIRLIGKS